MKRRRWGVRVLVVLAYLAPGAVLMGSSCAVDVRDAVLDAGVSFIGDTVSQLLDAVFPVEQIVAGGGG